MPYNTQINIRMHIIKARAVCGRSKALVTETKPLQAVTATAELCAWRKRSAVAKRETDGEGY